MRLLSITANGEPMPTMLTEFARRDEDEEEAGEHEILLIERVRAAVGGLGASLISTRGLIPGMDFCTVV
jgi:hypothetical protein